MKQINKMKQLYDFIWKINGVFNRYIFNNPL